MGWARNTSRCPLDSVKDLDIYNGVALRIGAGPELKFDSEGSSFHVPTEGSSDCHGCKAKPKSDERYKRQDQNSCAHIFPQPIPEWDGLR